MCPLASRAAVLLVIALFGCAQTVDLALPPPVTALPDLRGTWTGTWGGAPAQLVIIEQRELGDYAGIYLGPVQVLGRRRPGVSGVLTSTIAGASVSVNAEGWLGYANGNLTLLLRDHAVRLAAAHARSHRRRPMFRPRRVRLLVGPTRPDRDRPSVGA